MLFLSPLLARPSVADRPSGVPAIHYEACPFPPLGRPTWFLPGVVALRSRAAVYRRCRGARSGALLRGDVSLAICLVRSAARQADRNEPESVAALAGHAGHI